MCMFKEVYFGGSVFVSLIEPYDFYFKILYCRFYYGFNGAYLRYCFHNQ